MKIQKSIIILFISILISLNPINSIFIENSKADNFSEQKILITGFESWGKYTPNPSQLIVETLDGEKINNVQIVGYVAPVLWGEAVDLICQEINFYNPDIVISMGAGIINSIHVEKIGINLKSCIKPDNQGEIILLRRIDTKGPLLIFSKLPIDNIVSEIIEQDIPADKTYNAGSFICNEVFYGVLNYINKNNLPIKSGFIHVPLQTYQDPENGMELEKMIDAIKIALIVCIDEL